MEIHSPEASIHTWRDFFVHLSIMTIGLFLALMLEAGVEYVHHRHIVAEARANIRTEIEDNHKSAQQDLVLLQKNIARQKANIQTIHELQDHPKNFHGSVQNTMSFNSMDDAAWRTARDTGALAYMPYAEVQRYADLYMLENLVNTQAVATGQSDFAAAAPFDEGTDPGNLPASEIARTLHDNAAVEIQLSSLRQFVQQFDNLCIADLNQ